MPGFRMLAFMVWKGRVHSKSFESFLLFKNPIFKNMQITHISKIVQKSCLENFQINTKINYTEFERCRKKTIHLELYLKS